MSVTEKMSMLVPRQPLPDIVEPDAAITSLDRLSDVFHVEPVAARMTVAVDGQPGGLAVRG